MNRDANNDSNTVCKQLFIDILLPTVTVTVKFFSNLNSCFIHCLKFIEKNNNFIKLFLIKFVDNIIIFNKVLNIIKKIYIVLFYIIYV